MQRFFDWFQIISIIFFLIMFTGMTLYLLVGRRVNPFTIAFKNRKAQFILEFSILATVFLWVAEILIYSLHLQFRIFPGVLDTQLINSIQLKFLGVMAIIMGFIIYIWSLLCLKSSWRMAIDEKSPGRLITKGIFGISRNPIFIAFDLYFIGAFLINGTLIFLIFAVLTVTVLHCQALNEEGVLKRIYGQEYKDYAEKVGRYFTIS